MLREMDYDNIPIKLQSVHAEMNKLFDEDTAFLSAIGLYRIWSRRFQKPASLSITSAAGRRDL
jgi:tartronate-semialdehyde synthase